MNNKISPWNELDYYKEGQPIYGRDEDIRKISNSIINNLQTTLYGQSGIGKSSLLFAGIFPILRKEEYFPVFIRLGHVGKDESYVDYILDTIKKEAFLSDDKIGKEEITLRNILSQTDSQQSLSDSERLWKFFCGTEFINARNEVYIPVLVFDQFEEILNNRDTYCKAKQFILDIYSLFDDTRIPPDNGVPYSNFRVVFSLREDYLYCLEDIIDRNNLTELKYNRHRIKALSVTQAREVVIKTAKGDLESGKEQEICTKIIEQSQNYMGEVNTLMLSLICSTCYSNSADGIIKLSDLENSENYLYYYYENKMSIVSTATKEYLEKVLVTSDGRRDSVDIKISVDTGKVLQEEIDALEKNRIVRVISTSEGDRRVEFIHDRITAIINSKKQTIGQCLTNALSNMFKLNTRANAKEYRMVFGICSWIEILSMLLCVYYFDKDLWVSGLAYYIGVSSLFLEVSTSIRRCHDRNCSGWSGLFDIVNNMLKPSAQHMYSSGTSYIIAAKRAHPYQSDSRKEYIANHKGLLYTSLWLSLLVLFPCLLMDEYSVLIFVVYVVGVFMLGGAVGFVIRRLPSMGISPWIVLIPIIPWIYCFHEKKDETYCEINYGKILKYILSFVVLYWIIVFIFIYFL